MDEERELGVGQRDLDALPGEFPSCRIDLEGATRLHLATLGLGGAFALSACGKEPRPDTGRVATLTPDADAPPVTAPVDTPLHHAQTCALYLGPIPEVSCSGAEIMPITVDGEEVDATPQSCDRPSALTGTFETGERIAARYEGTHHGGSPRPEVVFVNFCRDGGMGVIGHNEKTGATCFFHINLEHDNAGRFPGSDDPDYDAYWEPPEVVAQDSCQSCHQADPWLHSPWIDQLRKPEEPTQTPLCACCTSGGPASVALALLGMLLLGCGRRRP